MGKIFGTDGARGIANTEISCELALNIGRAAALVLTKHTNHKPKIIIGMDTRVSSEMLNFALAAGICSVGADVLTLGVVPTPAVAYLIKKYNADAGVMVSASHNPVEFNGIKLFNSSGYKLSDDIENEIEDLILNPFTVPLKSGNEIGRIAHSCSGTEDYIEHIINTVSEDLSGIRIAVDCANGSASATAKDLFEKLKIKAEFIHSAPDGVNINERCGSTDMSSLIDYVKSHKCDCGIAFDGDADRCLFTDEKGNIIYGDTLMAVLSKSFYEKNKLSHNTLVTTVMSNMGLFKFASENNINVIKTKVGDRYVLEEMMRGNYTLGGEQSGHIIFFEHSTTGDGQLAAVQVLSVLKSSGKKMSELAGLMTVYPQVLIGIKADNNMKKLFEADEEIKLFISKTEKDLAGEGRVLVRVSGTEPIIRVMAEGRELSKINEAVTLISDKIKRKLGVLD